MTTKAKNTVKAQPVAKPKTAAGLLQTKVVANNKSKPAPTVKAVLPTKKATKMANKNSVAKRVVTPSEVVITGKLSKADKPKKIKMVRDSFSMPENEYMQFAALKRRCLMAGVHVKKSELLRAGLICLIKLSDPELVNVVGRVEILKTGRPPKH